MITNHRSVSVKDGFEVHNGCHFRIAWTSLFVFWIISFSQKIPFLGTTPRNNAFLPILSDYFYLGKTGGLPLSTSEEFSAFWTPSPFVRIATSLTISSLANPLPSVRTFFMNGLEEESFHDCDLPYYSASAGRGVVGPPVQLGQLSVACRLQRAERILLSLSLSPLWIPCKTRWGGEWGSQMRERGTGWFVSLVGVKSKCGKFNRNMT